VSSRSIFMKELLHLGHPRTGLKAGPCLPANNPSVSVGGECS